MVSSPLVSTDWLQDHLADPDLRILEIGSSVDDKPYREGHVPGAGWVYWKSAMANDLDRGNRLELDWLTGAAVALGRRLGVATPANNAIYALLKPYRMGRQNNPASSAAAP